MIVSASRRTDIPSYYSEWFFNRIKERFVYVRNPMNAHQVSKIDLSPDVVDCIVFWTKNPKPILHKLSTLKDYHYYFQFTVNSYGKDVEVNVPSKAHSVIETFKRLSDMIGKEKVIWRYDPILINAKYNADYHIKYFEKIAHELQDCTEKCTISFIDEYSKIAKNLKSLGIVEPTYDEKRSLAKNLSQIAFDYGLKMDICAEDIQLDDLGISHARCIDDRLISRITSTPIKASKDRNQRPACGCVESIDIGTYNTCLNGCKYCYANYDINTVRANHDNSYDASSPLLCGSIDPSMDIIRERAVTSLKQNQLSFFSI